MNSKKIALLYQTVSTQQPFLEIRDGRHPCISRTFSGGDFIPNDTVVGIKDVSMGILSTNIFKFLMKRIKSKLKRTPLSHSLAWIQNISPFSIGINFTAQPAIVDQIWKMFALIMRQM